MKAQNFFINLLDVDTWALFRGVPAPHIINTLRAAHTAATCQLKNDMRGFVNHYIRSRLVSAPSRPRPVLVGVVQQELLAHSLSHKMGPLLDEKHIKNMTYMTFEQRRELYHHLETLDVEYVLAKAHNVGAFLNGIIKKYANAAGPSTSGYHPS